MNYYLRQELPLGMQNLLAKDLDHVLEHTAAVWDALRGERIFITGGTGFFGCWLLESFAWASQKLDLDASAWVLSRNPAAFAAKAPHLASNPAIHLLEGEVRSFQYPAGEFSYIVHAANETRGPVAGDPLFTFDSNTEGTRRVLQFARRCGAKRLLLASSGAVYGKQPPELTHIPEDYAGAPDTMNAGSAYGQAKRVLEFISAVWASEYALEILIARGFAFLGPYLPLNAGYAAGNFIRDALRGGPISVNGDGTPYRSYLYTADLAIWLWTILIRGRGCRPYNVGSEVEITIRDLAGIVAKFSRAAVEVRGQYVHGKQAERYVPSTKRAFNELGLRQYILLDDAIQRTLEWNRSVAPGALSPVLSGKGNGNG